MRWTWDPNKNRENLSNHGFSFETAQLVFNDPNFITRLDHYPFEERWQTIGTVGNSIIIVVCTWPERGQPGRIITARLATRPERRLSEEGEI